MSLDLYLTTKTKRQHVGTGVFIRENGKNIELQTIEEVKAHFPDIDTSNIEERMYETNELFCKSISNNLGEMARHVPCNGGKNNLYQFLWRQYEHNVTRVTEQYRECIAECLSYMLLHRSELDQYNPSNGWGSYEGLLNFVIELSKELSYWDGKEEIEIVACR